MKLIRFPGPQMEPVGSGSPEHGKKNGRSIHRVRQLLGVEPRVDGRSRELEHAGLGKRARRVEEE